MARYEVLLLNTATPQIEAAQSGDTYLIPRTAEVATGADLLLYNTADKDTNYERGFMKWGSNILQIGTEAGGTGTARSIRIGSNSASATVEINPQISFFRFGVGTNYSASLSAHGLSGTSYAAADVFVQRVGAGILGVRANSGGSTGAALNFLEQTAPSAPSANQAVLYAEDNGSGKTRLMALFASGAAQQIAIEP